MTVINLTLTPAVLAALDRYRGEFPRVAVLERLLVESPAFARWCRRQGIVPLLRQTASRGQGRKAFRRTPRRRSMAQVNLPLSPETVAALDRYRESLADKRTPYAIPPRNPTIERLIVDSPKFRTWCEDNDIVLPTRAADGRRVRRRGKDGRMK